jgi:signal transduction histidine kinase
MKIPPEKVLGDRGFWKEKVFEEDRPRIWPLMESCLEEGTKFEAEYRVVVPSGEIIHVLDHALPVLDESGCVETVDGFLVDVTDRHCLQQQIIQTEELRTLTEVSARLAHEIRNPLTAAGGFARRMLQTLPEDDSNRGKVKIIIQEVARLEKILERTLAYLKPFDILTEKINLNEVIEKAVQEIEPFVRERDIQLTLALALDLVPISLDRVLLKSALENLLMALVGICHAGDRLAVRTQAGENSLNVEMTARGVQVSEDDIQHFFYPFTGGQNDAKTFDLPLAKMIIHKHGGLIDLKRKDSSQVQILISLPH